MDRREWKDYLHKLVDEFLDQSSDAELGDINDVGYLGFIKYVSHDFFENARKNIPKQESPVHKRIRGLLTPLTANTAISVVSVARALLDDHLVNDMHQGYIRVNHFLKGESQWEKFSTKDDLGNPGVSFITRV